MKDALDDLADFLMNRAVGPDMTDEERLATLSLLDAYQERHDPAWVARALKAAALKYAGHANYQRQWFISPVDGAAPAVPGPCSGELQALAPLRYATTDVLRIAYYEAGPIGGDAVLLLHGFPYDIHSFTEVIPKLVNAGKRVVVPYLRGHGPTRFLSAITPRSGQQGAIGADVIALLDSLGIRRAVLAGFDWGGRAACVAAALWPDRCAGLVSVNSYLIQQIAAARSPVEPHSGIGLWYFHHLLTEQVRAVLTANRENIARVIWRLNSPKWPFDESTFQRAAQAMSNPDYVEVVLHSYRHRLGQADGYPPYEPIEVMLAQGPPITIPTVTLDGMADGNSPAENGTASAHHFTGPRLHHQIPNAGHNLPEEAPDAFAAAVLQVQKLPQGQRHLTGGHV